MIVNVFKTSQYNNADINVNHFQYTGYKSSPLSKLKHHTPTKVNRLITEFIVIMTTVIIHDSINNAYLRLAIKDEGGDVTSY